MKHSSLILVFLLLQCGLTASGQDTLKKNSRQQHLREKTEYAGNAFKGTRIVIGQSIDNPDQGTLIFMVTHHFGLINGGYQNLFGLNQAFLRLGAECGVTKWLALGVGLNTYQLTWDGFVKAKILRQSKGGLNMPLSMSFFASTSMYTTTWADPERENYFWSRLSYAFSLPIARKFGNIASLQIQPEVVHRNLVKTAADHNNVWGIGAGGTIRLSEKVSVNAEYHYVFPGQVSSLKVYNSLSVGVDILTGGHVFQIFATNSIGEIEEYFIPETTSNWLDGGIYLGFNISRVFDIFKPRL